MGHRFFFKEGKPDAEDPGALAAAVAEGLHAEDEEGEDLGVPSDGAHERLRTTLIAGLRFHTGGAVPQSPGWMCRLFRGSGTASRRATLRG